MDAYLFVIGVCVIIIISFFFNVIARKTNIPSVLMLIFLGLGIQQLFRFLGIQPQFFNALEVLGIVGLIMIVLEAALDLELNKDKWPIIRNSFITAIVTLSLSSGIIAFIIQLFIQNIGFLPALIYAIPVSIMSSAIIIPSVSNLINHKREFMIYESTFSDILGIMFFYFLVENINANGVGEVFLSLSGNVLLTMVISMGLSYLLIFLIQKIKSGTPFFLFLAILILLYAIAKQFHLSSLLIILMFGLLLRNYKVLLFGKLKGWLREDAIDGIFENFKMITIETSFVVRTFFFVVFGFSIALSTLLDQQIWLITLSIIFILYLIRFLVFGLVERKDIFPQVFLAPRGLISVLLFYAIPEDYKVPEFENGVLMLVIIFSSLIMAWSLIVERKKGENKNIQAVADSEVNPDTEK